MKIGSIIRKVLYKTLSFNAYLKTLSSLYLWAFRRGLLKNNPSFKYPYFLKNIIKQGDTVLDIGANLGYYATLFARLVGNEGKVKCVEPVEPMLKVLRRNTKKYSNIEIFPYALGLENKEIILGNNSVKEKGFVATGQHFVLDANNTDDSSAAIEFKAQMKKGSELFKDLTKLNFIKCDIEGYETVVLPELKPLIEKFNPVLLVETNGDKKKELLAFFTPLGYGVYHLTNENTLEPDTPENKEDILFIHENAIKAYKSFLA